MSLYVANPREGGTSAASKAHGWIQLEGHLPLNIDLLQLVLSAHTEALLRCKAISRTEER